jgi:hypothetical protein
MVVEFVYRLNHPTSSNRKTLDEVLIGIRPGPSMVGNAALPPGVGIQSGIAPSDQPPNRCG